MKGEEGPSVFWAVSLKLSDRIACFSRTSRLKAQPEACMNRVRVPGSQNISLELHQLLTRHGTKSIFCITFNRPASITGIRSC